MDALFYLNTFKPLIKRFETELSEYRKLNPDKKYSSSALVDFMTGLVFRERTALNLTSEDLKKKVAHAELFGARGHFDYEHKFALYCAELVYE